MNSVSCLLFSHRLRNSNLDLTKKDYPEAPPFRFTTPLEDLQLLLHSLFSPRDPNQISPPYKKERNSQMTVRELKKALRRFDPDLHVVYSEPYFTEFYDTETIELSSGGNLVCLSRLPEKEE